QRRAARRVVRREWLHDQQLRALELSVLLGRHQRADDSADLHYSTSQWSTIPTIPASTGGSAGWNGKLASLPLTKNTSSPTPAPTESTATSGRPAASRAGVSGCTSSSLIPVNCSSFRGPATSAMTRAISMLRQASGKALPGKVDLVDDTHDGGIDRTILQARRHTRRAAADDEDGLADARIDGVDGDEEWTFDLSFRVDRSSQHELA